jgi:peptide/nickel transport system permease protein
VLGLLVRRLLVSIPLLLVVSFLVFGLIVLVPGDPAVALAGQNPDPAQIEAVRERLGLDDPFLVQYWHWLSGVLQGDLGTSLFTSQTVWTAIVARLPATLSLAFLALGLAAVVGVAVGSVAGLRPGTRIDRVSTVGASVGVAVPYFWVGMILVLLFSLQHPLLPAVGYVPLTEDPVGWFTHLVLPATALALAPAAVIARQTRASVATVMTEDYVRTATAKGLSPARVVGKHALKNAAIPAVTVIGLQVSTLLGGAVVIERLFSIPGLGTYLLAAITNYDIPVIQGVTVVFVLMNVVITLLVDISYGFLNPRVRVS